MIETKISLKELGKALEEWDYAKVAQSYGASPASSRNVILQTIKNLPVEEFEELKEHLRVLVAKSVDRTSKVLDEMGIELDEFPPKVRAGSLEPH